MSDTILTCFKCISDCLELYLAGNESAADIDRDAYIVVAGIGSIYTKNICICKTCAVDS